MHNNLQNEKIIETFKPFVGKINQTLDALLDVMNAQKEALLASNVEQIEALTEQHSQLSQDLREQETRFVTALHSHFEIEAGSDIKLSNLKTYFPDLAELIDSWRETLIEKTILLQQKHYQIVQLFEFAMLRNGNMMKTIYSLHNEKNMQYSATGKREHVVSGVAINQRV